jgi:hypothetical protein
VIMNLKKKIHDDVWNIIEKKEVDKPSDKDWVNIAFQLLLESDKFLIQNVLDLAKNIQEEYENLVNSVEDRIVNGNGEVLQVLKNIDLYYKDKIDPILKRIKRLKDREQ